jgi:hypothetical protein
LAITKQLLGLSLLALGVAAGCNEAPMTSEELDEIPQFGQTEEALCANGDGVNAAMAALAVSAAKELGRWQPTTDFTQHSSPWSLILTSAGKARCADGKCWNTQAILDLQKAPPGKVYLHGVQLNANNLVSTLVARWNEQRNCESRGGTGASNCSAEQHKLTYKSAVKGSCDTVFTFDATNTSGGLLKSPAQLKNKLIFVGGTANPFLAFSSTGTTVSIDPTYGLNNEGTTSSGSCTAACTRMTTSNVAGQCCSCNGKTAKFAKTTWNPNTYLCM